MSDQPLDSEFSGSTGATGDYRSDHQLSASERSVDWRPPPSRDASAALLLGILGFATCGLLSPFALYYSRRALHELDESGGSYAGERNARLGQLMGIIGTAMLVTGIALTLIFGLQAWDFLTHLDLSLPSRDQS
jgi:hypothetical protein